MLLAAIKASMKFKMLGLKSMDLSADDMQDDDKKINAFIEKILNSYFQSNVC